MAIIETLSQKLQPHKEVVGKAASIVTIIQFFAGAVLCKNIHEKKTTKGTSSLPFIGSIAMAILTIRYALLLHDNNMLLVNIVAILLNIIYTIIYFTYSPDRMEDLFKPMAYFAATVAIILGYAAVEDPNALEFRYGLILTVLMLLLLSAPLMDVKQIIEKKDASHIPFPLTFMGTIVSFLWLLYGIILLNYFMIVQNMIGFSLCSFQLTLWWMYPGPSAARTGSDENSKED